MTDEKQSVNVKILGEIQGIKDLESELREDNPFPVFDEDSFRNAKDVGITEQEIGEFERAYSNFIGGRISRIICDRLHEVYNSNESVIKGTSEGNYLKSLIEEVGKFKPNVVVEDIYDLKLEELQMSPRTVICLVKGGIDYVGQLAQTSEADIAIIDNLGKGRLNEIRGILSEYGLHFGMSIDYITPEERGKK